MEKGKKIMKKQKVPQFCQNCLNQKKIDYQKNSISEFKMKQCKYFYTLCWKTPFDSKLECYLIVSIEERESCFIGYADETTGFPLAEYPEATPIFREKQFIGNIDDVTHSGRTLKINFKVVPKITWSFQMPIALVQKWKKLIEFKEQLPSIMDEGNFLYFKTEEEEQNHKEGRYYPRKQKYQYLKQAGVKEEKNNTKKSQQQVNRKKIFQKNTATKNPADQNKCYEIEHKKIQKQLKKQPIEAQKQILSISPPKVVKTHTKLQQKQKVGKVNEQKINLYLKIQSIEQQHKIAHDKQVFNNIKELSAIQQQAKKLKSENQKLKKKLQEIHNKVSRQSSAFQIQIHEKKNEMALLKTQKNKLQEEILCQKKENQTLQRICQKLSREIELKTERISQLCQKQTNYLSQLQQYQTKQLNWQKQKTVLNSQKQIKLKQKQKNNHTNIEHLQDQLENKQQTIKEQVLTIHKLSQQLLQITTFSDELRTKLQTKTNQLHSMQKKLKECLEEIQEIATKIKKQEEQFFSQEALFAKNKSDQQRKVMELLSSLEEEKQRIFLIQKQIERRNIEQIQNKKILLLDFDEKLNRADKNTQQLQTKLQKLLQNYEEMSKQKQKDKNIDYFPTKLELKTIQPEKQSKVQQNQLFLERQLAELRQKYDQLAYKIFFNKTLLENYSDYKLFLKESIQKVKKRPISKTTHLYSSDPLNSTSFHKYIDQIPDIVLIVKTESEYFFAAYSQAPLSKQKAANKQGLLMSLTNMKIYPLTPGKRSVTYDTYFLIFGNSEIRIKHGEFKVFANFGIANGFFIPNGDNVKDILGAGKEREVKIIGFEVFQVFFD